MDPASPVLTSSPSDSQKHWASWHAQVKVEKGRKQALAVSLGHSESCGRLVRCVLACLGCWLWRHLSSPCFLGREGPSKRRSHGWRQAAGEETGGAPLRRQVEQTAGTGRPGKPCQWLTGGQAAADAGLSASFLLCSYVWAKESRRPGCQ